MSCSSSDDDEFVLSVYNKKAVKSNFNRNLCDLMKQLPKKSSNVIKDNEAGEKAADKEKTSKSKENQEKFESGSLRSSPVCEIDLGSKDDSNSLDIVLETETNNRIENGDSFEVIHEHIISNTPANSTRRSKRLRKELEQQGERAVLPKPKPRRLPRKHKGKTIDDYFGPKEKTVEDNIITIDDIDEVVEECSDDDEINSEVSVKVLWKSVQIRRFQLRKFQKFSKIFEILMDEEKVPIDKIYLTLKGQRIKSSDTPESLNLKIYDFIEGGVLSETCSDLNLTGNNRDSDSDDDDSVISIKFQDNKKKIVKLKLKNTEKMKIVMLKYAEQIDVPFEKIKFLFEGETIDPNTTPNDLELCNDEVIDVKF